VRARAGTAFADVETAEGLGPNPTGCGGDVDFTAADGAIHFYSEEKEGIMPRLNLARMGKELTGWSNKDGTAAVYHRQGSNYRTYKPMVMQTPAGGLFVSTKIDHIRGNGLTDALAADYSPSPCGRGQGEGRMEVAKALAGLIIPHAHVKTGLRMIIINSLNR
jgi:hypothetical protein